jgi:Lipopolysaccharide-assembly
VLPVTTSSDVAAFVTDHAKDTLRQAGLNVVDGPGALTLSGEIRQYFVTETGTYQSQLSVVVHLKDTQGKEVWSGAIVGGTERFGRSYKADNYYETLSDAVTRATHNLLSNPGFTDAFQKH